jgi:cyclin B
VNSSYKFFEPLSKVIGLEPKNFHLAQYLLELSMLKSRFLVYSPSLIASSAIYLIKKIRKSESSWNELMTTLVGYK